MPRFFEGSCGCGSQVYAEVEDDMRCERCGYVFVYSKRLRMKMGKGFCSNCGAILFSSTETLSAIRTEVRPNL